jgi:putative restriction endonuclease
MANRVFGHISGNPVGTTYVNRDAAADADVHRPNQGGIWGGKDGAESIVVSGGYIDDQDYGDVIIYTGQGGRDQNSGRQIADQELIRGNLGLARSHLDGLPVRVIRGYEGDPYLLAEHWLSIRRAVSGRRVLARDGQGRVSDLAIPSRRRRR